jgi:hypothetical protein
MVMLVGSPLCEGVGFSFSLIRNTRTPRAYGNLPCVRPLDLVWTGRRISDAGHGIGDVQLCGHAMEQDMHRKHKAEQESRHGLCFLESDGVQETVILINVSVRWS